VAGDVHFGIYVPQVGFAWPDILQRARMADEAGIHSMWFYDHLYAPGLPAVPSLEAWTLASYVLASTPRLRVGHLVLCNSFRHPALLAKMAATLDVCSGGRLELGLGSGSVESEHTEMGLPWGTPGERSARLGEALAIITDMLSETTDRGEPPTTTVHGDYYRVEGLPNLPRPLQKPRPPIHVGGIGASTLPLVARYADVWNVPTYGLAQREQRREALEAACAEVGRDPATLRHSIEAVLVLARDARSLTKARAVAERRYGGPGWGLDDGGYVGTPTEVIDRIAAQVERGVRLFIFFTHDRAEPETIALLGEEIVPAFT
jgi:alkanesulfonate monooxygenase SsuD/methylene tetrahydromethanopterin reductase-like flavin-dependent oxidoreductase (luciferase family)